jgi:predicted ABC-type ATPase
MIGRIQALARSGESFAFETTCSSRGHARLLQTCRVLGYRLTLVFLWLPSVEAALARVAQRVREGGHAVPDAIVARRYAAGLRNMRHLYLPLVDVGLIFDNSDDAGPALIAERTPAAPFAIHSPARWAAIEEATR